MRSRRGPQPEFFPAEAKDRQRESLVNFIRLAYLVVFIVTAFLYVAELVPPDVEGGGGGSLRNVPWSVGLAIFLGIAVLAIDILTPRKRISALFAIFIGLVVAMLATWAFGFLVDLLARLYDFEGSKLVQAFKLMAGVCIVYLSISTVLQTQDDFRLVIPYVEFAKEIRGSRPLLLDSSALIDARIAELGETGLVQAPVVIPSFVIAELQLLADQSDKARRARGRRGLDLVARLQRSGKLDVTIDETPIPGKAVDQMMIELARRMPAIIVTTDSGLARVAAIKNVSVINVHDLATALKPSISVGDMAVVKLVKPGEQPGQAVAYLEDGTMVVVDDARELIGSTQNVIVASTLQTAAGRLVFARVVDEQGNERDSDQDAPASAQDARPAPEPSGPHHHREPTATGPNSTPGNPGPIGPRPGESPKRGNSPRNPRR